MMSPAWRPWSRRLPHKTNLTPRERGGGRLIALPVSLALYAQYAYSISRPAFAETRSRRYNGWVVLRRIRLEDVNEMVQR